MMMNRGINLIVLCVCMCGRFPQVTHPGGHDNIVILFLFPYIFLFSVVFDFEKNGS